MPSISSHSRWSGAEWSESRKKRYTGNGSRDPRVRTWIAMRPRKRPFSLFLLFLSPLSPFSLLHSSSLSLPLVLARRPRVSECAHDNQPGRVERRSTPPRRGFERRTLNTDCECVSQPRALRGRVRECTASRMSSLAILRAQSRPAQPAATFSCASTTPRYTRVTPVTGISAGSSACWVASTRTTPLFRSWTDHTQFESFSSCRPSRRSFAPEITPSFGEQP